MAIPRWFVASAVLIIVVFSILLVTVQPPMQGPITVNVPAPPSVAVPVHPAQPADTPIKASVIVPAAPTPQH